MATDYYLISNLDAYLKQVTALVGYFECVSRMIRDSIFKTWRYVAFSVGFYPTNLTLFFARFA